MSRRRLTDRQRRFVAAYAADPNAARAARLAGYSPSRAKQTGSELLGRPDILRALAERRADNPPDNPPESLPENLPENLSDMVLREDAIVAFADPRACFGSDGAPLPPSELPEATARAVASVECKETAAKGGGVTRTWKYAFWSKEKALERLARHLGLAGRDPEKGRRAVVNFVMDLGGEHPRAALEPQDRREDENAR